MILCGSNLRNANTGAPTSLLPLFASGGFQRGQQLALDRENNCRLPTLIVVMLQRVGLEEDRCESGAGSMRGLDRA